MILSDVWDLGSPKLESFSKSPWEIKLSRSEVLYAQGIQKEVSKSACSWTSRVRMRLPMTELVSSLVANSYLIRSNWRVCLGLQVLGSIVHHGGKSRIGGRWVLLVSHSVEQEAECIQELGCDDNSARHAPCYTLLPARFYLLNVPQPSKDSTTHWGLVVQTYGDMGAFYIQTTCSINQSINQSIPMGCNASR